LPLRRHLPASWASLNGRRHGEVPKGARNTSCLGLPAPRGCGRMEE
jgi:hypothetical protein